MLRGLKFLMPVTKEITIFWDVTPYSLAEVY
jgi:hypothetical protein